MKESSKKITETIARRTSKDIPGEIPGVMPGEIPRGHLEEISVGISDGITEGSYGKISAGIRRCILAEVSVNISEGIVRGIPEAFFGTCPGTITIGTLEDVHERIHEEILGKVPE